MRLLITGATGFLGGRLVERFAQCEEFTSILATGRKFSSDNKTEAAHVRYVLGDLADGAFVKTLFEEQVDVVVNCASLSSPWGSYAQFFQANCTTQSLLIEESIAARVKRFIYISTPSIYFNFKDALGITEGSELPQKKVNHYAETKWMAENLLRQSGLQFVILRPRALIGRGDTVIMPRLIRSYREGKLRVMGAGKNRVDLTPVSNMVEAVRLAITTEEANVNNDYNISNGEPVNLWESINYLLEAIGYQKIKEKLPYHLLLAVARLMEWNALLRANQPEPVLTRYAVGVLAKSFTFQITKAERNLGYRPVQTTRQAMDEFANWYKSRSHE